MYILFDIKLYNNTLFISIKDIPVLSETTLLAFVINRQRPFQFTHGDVVHTPDVLGQRFGMLLTFERKHLIQDSDIYHVYNACTKLISDKFSF